MIMEKENFKKYQSELCDYCLTHKISSKTHKITQSESAYQNFYNTYSNLELDLCKDFDTADYEALNVFEKFIGE